MAEVTASDATTERDTVAVVIVTYNRADVLVGCLDGLAAQTSPPDAVFVVDNASSDHTAEVLQRAHGPAAAHHPQRGEPRRRRRVPPRRRPGVRRGLRPDLADGRRRGPRARVPAGAARPSRTGADGRARGHRGTAGGEGGTRLRPGQPVRDPAQARLGRRPLAPPERDAGGGGAGERRVRGLHGPPAGDRRDRAAGPVVLHLLRRLRLRDPRPAGRLHPPRACATRCWSASSTSTSSTRWTRGRGSTCTGTSSRSTSGTARTCWSGSSRT